MNICRVSKDKWTDRMSTLSSVMQIDPGFLPVGASVKLKCYETGMQQQFTHTLYGTLEAVGPEFQGEPEASIEQIPVDRPLKYGHYKKDVRHLDMIDVYRVIDLWGPMHPAQEHALKKILCTGQRGAKDCDKDIQEAIDSLERWKIMRMEDAQKAAP